MNKDQVAGLVDSVKGKVKEAIGKAASSEKVEGEGLADQISGKAQSIYGDVKEKLKDVKEVIEDTVKKI